MAAEIFAQHTAGAAIDAYLLRAGQIWNGSGFVTPVAANWASYALAMTEIPVTGGLSFYVRDFPAAITTAGVYAIVSRLRAGGSPAVGDVVFGPPVSIAWDGTAEIIGGLNTGAAHYPTGGGNQVG
ncbi:MAG: hypothetical protein K2Y37_14795 [Pirellulales bacterium]|nr:hypothetical protein [Pirellulales bacterium]